MRDINEACEHLLIIAKHIRHRFHFEQDLDCMIHIDDAMALISITPGKKDIEILVMTQDDSGRPQALLYKSDNRPYHRRLKNQIAPGRSS